MILTRRQKIIVGILVLFIAVRLLLGSIGVGDFSVWDLWPLLIIYIGWRFWRRQRRILGGFLLAWGGLFALEEWFFISADDLIGLLLAGVLFYLGYRLIRTRSDAEPFEQGAGTAAAKSQPQMGEGGAAQRRSGGWQEEVDRAFRDAKRAWKYYQEHKNAFRPHEKWREKGWHAGRQKVGSASPYETEQVFSPLESRSSLFGDFHLTSGRFELRNLQIWQGVGDVKIDLSRALLPEAETFLVINGWVGDVTVYVPVDLSVSVAAEVTIGDIEALGHRQGGINRRVMMKSRNYDDAVRKVNIIVSLIVGDIDVRYI